ncbi:GNAT family N-acetyltransferase [Aeromonas veronii]|uniref:GNAT family N-acetyltransferase n=1 Tax=Aeromonas veronii TaxID=654 RepID=A0A4S5CPI5_AERVE|nr:GNAT family N-acetyltransferase [Aeromonas veronii]THJ45096.1 GNAT family N-acetyltransferase [Aeromonas veronii]
MTPMTDPHNALVSFQAAISSGSIHPHPCPRHEGLFLYVDGPCARPRTTFAMIDHQHTVKALVTGVCDRYVDAIPGFNLGYAVAEPFRRQGVATDILLKAIGEMQFLAAKAHQDQLYVLAVVGVDNLASQAVASRCICESPVLTTDGLSGLPAFLYQRLLSVTD